jgi:hypothetical protein
VEELRNVGLYILRFTPSDNVVTLDERFSACFGATAEAYAKIWLDIQMEELGDSRITKATAFCFLMTAYF